MNILWSKLELRIYDTLTNTYLKIGTTVVVVYYASITHLYKSDLMYKLFSQSVWSVNTYGS